MVVSVDDSLQNLIFVANQQVFDAALRDQSGNLFARRRSIDDDRTLSHDVPNFDLVFKKQVSVFDELLPENLAFGVQSSLQNLFNDGLAMWFRAGFVFSFFLWFAKKHPRGSRCQNWQDDNQQNEYGSRHAGFHTLIV